MSFTHVDAVHGRQLTEEEVDAILATQQTPLSATLSSPGANSGSRASPTSHQHHQPLQQTIRTTTTTNPSSPPSISSLQGSPFQSSHHPPGQSATTASFQMGSFLQDNNPLSPMNSASPSLLPPAAAVPTTLHGKTKHFHALRKIVTKPVPMMDTENEVATLIASRDESRSASRSSSPRSIGNNNASSTTQQRALMRFTSPTSLVLSLADREGNYSYSSSNSKPSLLLGSKSNPVSPSSFALSTSNLVIQVTPQLKPQHQQQPQNNLHHVDPAAASSPWPLFAQPVPHNDLPTSKVVGDRGADSQPTKRRTSHASAFSPPPPPLSIKGCLGSSSSVGSDLDSHHHSGSGLGSNPTVPMTVDPLLANAGDSLSSPPAHTLDLPRFQDRTRGDGQLIVLPLVQQQQQQRSIQHQQNSLSKLEKSATSNSGPPPPIPTPQPQTKQQQQQQQPTITLMLPTGSFPSSSSTNTTTSGGGSALVSLLSTPNAACWNNATLSSNSSIHQHHRSSTNINHSNVIEELPLFFQPSSSHSTTAHTIIGAPQALIPVSSSSTAQQQQQQQHPTSSGNSNLQQRTPSWVVTPPPQQQSRPSLFVPQTHQQSTTDDDQPLDGNDEAARRPHTNRQQHQQHQPQQQLPLLNWCQPQRRHKQPQGLPPQPLWGLQLLHEARKTTVKRQLPPSSVNL